MAKRPLPTRDDVVAWLEKRRNWGRWGDKGGAGTINLITPEKRIEAARLVKSGRTVSLSRPFPVTPSAENTVPAHHYMFDLKTPTGGHFAMDYLGIAYHGQVTTHIDALCHVYANGQMFDGRDPAKEVTFRGARFGSVDLWSDGIVTRGVLLDVPRRKGKPYATFEDPIHGWDLEEAAKVEGVRVGPGDAVCVYGGREAFSKDNPPGWAAQAKRPGLHASCLPFLRDNDVSVLVWDMMDLSPNGYDVPYTIHGAIQAYGLALLDNALLQPLAEACAREGRWEFMLTINPLKVIGGTGSPVNPIAIF